MNGVRTEARGLFIRRQDEAMRHICIDLCTAKRNNQVDRFHEHWLTKPCQWFAFDDGDRCWAQPSSVWCCFDYARANCWNRT
jgi:hypothetical protein